MDWQVHLEVEIGGEPLISHDGELHEDVDNLADALDGHDGVVGGSANELSVNLVIAADDAVHAAIYARGEVFQALHTVGRKPGSVVSLEVIPDDE